MKKEYFKPSVEFVAFNYSEQIAASGATNDCYQTGWYVIKSGLYYTDSHSGCKSSSISGSNDATLVWVGDVS